MKKKTLYFFFFLICLFKTPLFSHEITGIYSSIVEKILYYKDDKFKLFYGGPIDRSNGSLKWLSAISFEDEDYKTRAVYDLAFINCDFRDTEDAELLFIKVSDINIKFKNTLSKDYKTFSNLLAGGHSKKKYIIIRQSDISILYFPEIFIAKKADKNLEKKDQQKIANFLHHHFKTKKTLIHYPTQEESCEIDFENAKEISYKPLSVAIDFKSKITDFKITKKIIKDDQWKLYYIISKDSPSSQSEEPTLIRIDSGCISGQIYDDESCDCLDQLHDGLYQLSQECGENSLIIHIPAHDGRGFGMAPKAETEIYKRGGKGRVHTTIPLDTIAAAKLLYGSLNYDLRTYDGAAKILQSIGITHVSLLTDNIVKVSALEKHGIQVVRKKTGSNKLSCIEHIQSKKQSANYYDN